MNSTRSSISFPKLRSVDVRPFHQNGAPYFLLQDPLKLSDEGVLAVPQAFGPLLALCDGRYPDARALSMAVQLRYGIEVDPRTVEALLRALDEAHLLENGRAQEALLQKRAWYRDLDARPMSHAGLAYPAEADELARLLDSYRDGLPQPDRANGHHRSTARHPGVFSPHIDYARGGPVYAQTWREAAHLAEDAELVILVGTDHYGDDLFTLTRQNYATPFGVLPTATQVVDELAQALGESAAYAGELRHLREHSLELVAVWLQHARGRRPVPLVPVLVGSMHRFFANPASPSENERIRCFLDVLGRYAAQKRTLIVASGDLAHVGPAFGGAPLTSDARLKLRQDDEELMGYFRQGDPEGFYNFIRRINDRNNVCGVTPGYLMLHLVGAGAQGRQIAYDSCPADERNQSAVTICGMVYE
ncbi:MAG: AmmeMemoRadiSam system protein B [Caldilineae bacterium]|nr:MAG: AmmeMemoRadiSam system protein B [Caldilineae bacterium]